MNSLQGQFLVAAPRQLDPNFAKAVILVVEHTNRGAFGVIVNGPGEESSRFQHRNSRWCFRERLRISFGGPVTGPLMALHTRASLGERQLLPGVFFSAKKKNVRRLIWQAARPCKIFAGYAGWGPGQLDYEVEQGVWRVVPATPAQIFSQQRRSLGAAFTPGVPAANADHVPRQAYPGRPPAELRARPWQLQPRRRNNAMPSRPPPARRDEELLAIYATTGSREAFEELVRRYEREIYSYLYHFLRRHPIGRGCLPGHLPATAPQMPPVRAGPGAAAMAPRHRQQPGGRPAAAESTAQGGQLEHPAAATPAPTTNGSRWAICCESRMPASLPPGDRSRIVNEPAWPWTRFPPS